MKSFYTLLLFLACTLAASAQDLQTINDGFFDPTAKKKKEKTEYQFHTNYRVEVDYVQNDLRYNHSATRYGLLNGFRAGAVVDFCLPYEFVVQTGLKYQFTDGQWQQHFRSLTTETAQPEYLGHHVMQHQLVIPVRVNYCVPFGKSGWGIFFYTGPQLEIGLVGQDRITKHLSTQAEEWLTGSQISQPIMTEDYDRYKHDTQRCNVQWSIGGGFDWKQLRLQVGYDFGLNNIARGKSYRLNEWAWSIGLSVRL